MPLCGFLEKARGPSATANSWLTTLAEPIQKEMRVTSHRCFPSGCPYSPPFPFKAPSNFRSPPSRTAQVGSSPGGTFFCVSVREFHLTSLSGPLRFVGATLDKLESAQMLIDAAVFSSQSWFFVPPWHALQRPFFWSSLESPKCGCLVYRRVTRIPPSGNSPS